MTGRRTDNRTGTRRLRAAPSRLRRVLVILLALEIVAALGIGAAVLLSRTTADSSRAAAESAAAGLPAASIPDLSRPAPVLADDIADEPIPDPSLLADVLATAVADPRLGERLLARVVDGASGNVLYDTAGDTPGTPASNAKLVTAYAALTTLDPGMRLTTRVVTGSAPGEIALIGGGDTTLSRTTPSLSYPEAATVAQLAQAVLAASSTAVTRIVVDGSLFTGPAVSPAWRSGDAPSTYAAPITAAMVDGGRVTPESRSRSGSPDLDAGLALAAALGVAGIPVVVGTAVPDGRLLGAVSSAPISRLVETMLAQSDNVLAESLGRHIALARGLPGDFTGAATGIAQAIGEGGFDTGGMEIVDGSGLSAENAVPPRLLTDLLRAAAVENGDSRLSAISSGLPVAGYDGTLFERYPGGVVSGAGSVRAKTGTLDGVNALAGFVVTAQGRMLVFAFIADRLPPGPLIIGEPALDAIAGILAACGCS